MRDLTVPGLWTGHLSGIEAVVNCVGILQDAPGESTQAIHADAVAALTKACESAGVRRLIHFSAMGVDRETVSAYSSSKRSGEAAVVASKLDWVILRPAPVMGRQAYGGSAAFRGLAALPALPVLPGTGPMQVVQLDDVVETVLTFLDPRSPSRIALDLAGPDRLSFKDVVGAYRSWLGWPPARTLAVPGWAARVMYGLGDLASWLGWRPALRSNVRAELARGATGDPKPWTEATGIEPRSLADALTAEPAGVQERWFAALYVLKPIILIVLALFWATTGWLSVGPGYHIGVDLMLEGGAGVLAGPSVIAGGLADLAIGIGIAIRRTARPALWAGIALALFYAVAGSILLPRLWIEPLGPLLKIWPIILLMSVALATLRDR